MTAGRTIVYATISLVACIIPGVFIPSYWPGDDYIRIGSITFCIEALLASPVVLLILIFFTDTVVKRPNRRRIKKLRTCGDEETELLINEMLDLEHRQEDLKRSHPRPMRNATNPARPLKK